MAELPRESISIHNHENRLVHADTGHDDDYDISSNPPYRSDEHVRSKKEDQLRKQIEKMKRANKLLFRADVKPVILDDFQDLLLPEKLEEIKASKGRLKINKLLYDADQVSDILSMVVTKLMQGAPGDSGSKAVKKNADKFAMDIAPRIAEIRQNPSFQTFRQVAAELTKRKIPTNRKSETEIDWHPTSVRNVEIRIEKLKKSGKLKPVL